MEQSWHWWGPGDTVSLQQIRRGAPCTMDAIRDRQALLAADPAWRLPFRPDHGHELPGDVGTDGFPGYFAIGRLMGLAAIRGVPTAVTRLGSLPR